jgi:2Fe-2S ferredoxin
LSAGRRDRCAEGVSICDTLLGAGIEIEHACEKSCACTTCHVVVRDGYASLDDPEEKEEDLLDKAWGLEATSRLSCQAKMRGGGSGDRDPEVHDQLRARGRQPQVTQMKWTDSREIALALIEKYAGIDPNRVNFVDLYKWVLELEGFSDDPKRCGEKILEAIQMAWIEEAE